MLYDKSLYARLNLPLVYLMYSAFVHMYLYDQRVFVVMILNLVFAEVLGLYG